jgi:hypothetical protein
MNLATVLWTATRLSRLSVSSLSGRLAILAIFAVWVPLQLTLFHGQLGILPALGILQAIVAVRSGHDLRAGWWLSLGLIKPQLILFPLLVFMVWGRWRTVMAFFIALAGALGISIGTIGFWVKSYVHFLMDYNRRGAELSLYPAAMQNWRGLVCWLVKTDRGLAVWSVLLVLSVISIVTVLLICYRHSGDLDFEYSSSLQGEARYATAVLLGLLSSPHLYMHDWVVALPAGFILWSFARESYSRGVSMKYRAEALLWLLGLAPVVFFGAQFVWSGPTVPLFVAVLVAVTIVTLGALARSPQSNAETHTGRPPFVERPSSARMVENRCSLLCGSPHHTSSD